jgi:hypothetical protein
MNKRIIFGLDLGRAQDFTGLAIAQQTPGTDIVRPVSAYAFRHLQRWPSGTPNPQIVADVAGMVKKVPEAELVVDGTACGRAVLDLFCYANWSASVTPITITGGDEVAQTAKGWRVPKRDLVSCVQAALQTKRLKIAAGLLESWTLRRELQAFQAKITVGPETPDSWRERDRDDLVLGVALAVWFGENVGGCWECSTGGRSLFYQSGEAPLPGAHRRDRYEPDDEDDLPRGFLDFPESM